MLADDDADHSVTVVLAGGQTFPYYPTRNVVYVTCMLQAITYVYIFITCNYIHACFHNMHVTGNYMHVMKTCKYAKLLQTQKQ